MAVCIDNPAELSVYLWGRYEDDVTAVIRTALRRGRSAIDVGANCGVLTLGMRAVAGEGGRVLAVDPSPAAIARVTAHAKRNGFTNILTETAALGAAPTRERFFDALIGIGMLPADDHENATGKGREVIVETLDRLTERNRLREVDLVKLDTDGSEPAILAGASELLRSQGPVVVFEVLVDGMRRRGHEPVELAEILADHGYDLLRPVMTQASPLFVAPPRLVRFADAAVDDLARGEIDHVNVVALRRADPRHQHLRRRLREPLTAP